MKTRTGAIIVFYNDEGKILLQERWNYSKIWEEWAFFGGWVEEWETPLEGFFREAREELALDMAEFDYTYIWEQIQYYPERDFQATRHFYLIKTDKKESDFTVLEWAGCKYFTIEEARKLKFPLDQNKMMDLISKYIFKDKLVEQAIYLLTKYFPESFESKKPILLHSLRVGMYLYERNYETDIVLAWFLHDIIEDTIVSKEEIISLFWEEVYELILANTKNDTLEKWTKSKELISRCANHSQKALIVKMSDVWDNFCYYKKVNNLPEIERCKKNAWLILENKKEDYTDEIFQLLDKIQ